MFPAFVYVYLSALAYVIYVHMHVSLPSAHKFAVSHTHLPQVCAQSHPPTHLYEAASTSLPSLLSLCITLQIKGQLGV